jgi:hypothetical protein
VRTSEDKVRIKDLCLFVGVVYDPRGLPGSIPVVTENRCLAAHPWDSYLAVINPLNSSAYSC